MMSSSSSIAALLGLLLSGGLGVLALATDCMRAESPWSAPYLSPSQLSALLVLALGRLLGLPENIVGRQPFPGPGLAIRVIGEITREKLDLLREADAIFREELGRLEETPDQYFAVLTDTRSVGVMGDGRTYDYTLALRAVRTNDFMTCDFARLPWETLARASARITNEVRGINRVVYDVTAKPPATIEWE